MSGRAARFCFGAIAAVVLAAACGHLAAARPAEGSWHRDGGWHVATAPRQAVGHDPVWRSADWRG